MDVSEEAAEQEAPQEITCTVGMKIKFGAGFGPRPEPVKEEEDDND
jgi:hypothetical protein